MIELHVSSKKSDTEFVCSILNKRTVQKLPKKSGHTSCANGNLSPIFLENAVLGTCKAIV